MNDSLYALVVEIKGGGEEIKGAEETRTGYESNRLQYFLHGIMGRISYESNRKN